MKSIIKHKNTLDLAKVLLKLKNLSEAKRFLRDLLTESELKEFGNRWLAVRMLNKKVSYSEIVKKTGLSSTTIARIAWWLKKGRGGYRLMLRRFKG